MILRTFYIVIFLESLFMDNVYMKPKTDDSEQRGPCVGMDCLHGVLMHNDEKQGEEHNAEDQYLRFKAVLDTENPRVGPQDAEEQFHGVLMHDGSESGNHHVENDEILPEQKKEVGPKDLSEMIHEGMHGETGSHGKHSWDEKKDANQDKSGPRGERFMHGLLMHGDENYVHTDGDDSEIVEDSSTKKVGPQDAEEYLHGVLMHGDSEPGADHVHVSVDVAAVENKGNAGPNNDLHGILMHGDNELGHDHSHEDASMEYEVFNDITKILEMELDDELMRIIDIKQILEKDRREYAEWILSNPQFMDETIMGSTRADISDGILDDIELMKKRYLADMSDSDKEQMKKPEDEHPFTAEDALSVYNEEEHAEEGEDMRHDLELAGSTEPINARHKVKMALMKANEE
ncbi:hypothetical protein ACF0H5_020490 [Mactra antiquata]